MLVADLTSRERLQPSLLDRLTDDEPLKQSEPQDAAAMTRTRLRRAVLRDLAWLLNSTALLDPERSRQTPAGTSVLNYGLPPLAGNSASSIDVLALEGLIHQAIATFEPRILRHTLRVRAHKAAGEMNHNALSFEIEGDLWAQPVPLPLLLRTELDLESGHVSVVPAQQRRRP